MGSKSRDLSPDIHLISDPPFLIDSFKKERKMSKDLISIFEIIFLDCCIYYYVKLKVKIIIWLITFSSYRFLTCPSGSLLHVSRPLSCLFYSNFYSHNLKWQSVRLPTPQVEMAETVMLDPASLLKNCFVSSSVKVLSCILKFFVNSIFHLLPYNFEQPEIAMPSKHASHILTHQ